MKLVLQNSPERHFEVEAFLQSVETNMGTQAVRTQQHKG